MAPSVQKSALAALAASSCAVASASSSNSAFVSVPGVQTEAQLRGLSTSAPGAPSAAASASSSSVFAAVGTALGAAALAASTRRLQRKDAQVSHARGVTMVRAFENELGVQPPVGFWDPAGFTSDGDPKEFYRRRCIEIKHGRVSMLACLGYITQEFVRFPGYLSPTSAIKFADIPNGLNGVTKVPAVGWFQYTVFCGLCELWIMHQVPENPPGKLCTRFWGEDATNYGYGSIGVPNYLGGKSIDDPEMKKKKLNAEIANGRLAMMAIIGMFFQDGLTGSAWGDWANYTESPLRASAKELLGDTGGPFPENFWDPAGITNNKSEQEILELRAIELKHARVAMLAVVGWFANAAGNHFIGDYAVGVKVSNDPIVALTQLPMGAVWQVVFTILCLEWLTTYVCKPPADRPWDVLGWKDILATTENPEWKRAEQQELNNGRLAMVAIVGLILGEMMTGEYGEFIGKFCGGSSLCDGLETGIASDGGPPKMQEMIPPTPYKYPPLYPRAWGLHAPGSPQF